MFLSGEVIKSHVQKDTMQSFKIALIYPLLQQRWWAQCAQHTRAFCLEGFTLKWREFLNGECTGNYTAINRKTIKLFLRVGEPTSRNPTEPQPTLHQVSKISLAVSAPFPHPLPFCLYTYSLGKIETQCMLKIFILDPRTDICSATLSHLPTHYHYPPCTTQMDTTTPSPNWGTFTCFHILIITKH